MNEENVVPIPIAEIPKNEGKVLIKFSLPFEAVEDGDYNVSIKGHIAKISIRRILSQEHLEKITGWKVSLRGSGRAGIADDTRGISVISQVEILIPYVTDWKYLPQLVLEYMNKLLDVWRLVTGKFWLKESISERDIFRMIWSANASSGKGHRGTFLLGVPGIKLPIEWEIRETASALPHINKCLIDDTRIPLFQILKLNALNHYIERRFDLQLLK